ncbi:hypothetical protein AM1_4109 [Acaryochloris marina MBIC11017]|uniref:Uncharacterized protein n=1 Tax=Acaryochloris marina (strain MBIC 11017) TaxID=329726 RepID=B0CAM4_ACAM1|nr:hypothetical protein AM1_4109 [Acaryochloris marina MBIC11017]
MTLTRQNTEGIPGKLFLKSLQHLREYINYFSKDYMKEIKIQNIKRPMTSP